MSFSIQSVYNWYRNTLRNPKYRWWIILGTLVYLLSPFDIAPDFLPVVGQIDDIAIVTLLVAELSQMGIEYFKSRPGKSSEVAAGAENDGSNPAAKTVDVEASSVK
jgi:uncharacterized membrane protein YkvA (DUF1232 family)